MFAHLAECEYCREWVDVHSRFKTPARQHSRTLFWTAIPALACALAALWLVMSPSTPERARGAEQTWTQNRPLEQISLRSFRMANPNDKLPDPLAFARLNNHLSFLASSSGRASNQIVLRTTYGEKWITLDVKSRMPQEY